jgi:hypothetical protein
MELQEEISTNVEDNKLATEGDKVQYRIFLFKGILC